MIIFETERLIVRQFTQLDKDNFFSLNGDPVVMKYIRAPKSRVECDAFLQQVIADYVKPHVGRWAVCEKEGLTFVGSFAIIPVPSMPGKIQLGYSFTPQNWGKGFATEITRAGLDYFLENHTLPEIFGVVEKPNTASRAVLEKAGFTFFGTMMEDDKELEVFVTRRDLSPGPS